MNNGNKSTVGLAERYGSPVEWRGTTASRTEGLISISFVGKTGEVSRLLLDFHQASKLHRSLADHLPAYTGVQSAKSSGIPISDGSLPQEGQNV